MNQEAVARKQRSAGGLRGLVWSRLSGIESGTLTIRDAEAWTTVGSGLPHATLNVHDARLYRSLVWGGHIGAAEAFMDGWWDADDLVGLVRILVRNRDVLDGLETGWARLAQPLRVLAHWLRRNTKAGSRRNIAAHYDLGNEFFGLFLDPSLMYSCAYFERDGSTLAEASAAKNDLVCRKLDLRPEDHLLEIGTGWGGFALHAAERYGCRVTTTTISREQHRLAKQRVERAGLEGRVTLLQADYRDLEGQFDKLVSIEMIEAVGAKYYGTFFATCSRLLKPTGSMLLQAITLRDRYYDTCRREVDFIKRYIFPGSCIPSVSVLSTAVARHGDLRLSHLQDLTPHYAETLACWRSNLLRNRKTATALGFPEELLRMWEFYFCYCEGGFRERFLGNVHMHLVKPGCDREPLR
ncbi:MAG: class I SAM-dependent methyltransferase [Planctomycetaceae bacterium]